MKDELSTMKNEAKLIRITNDAGIPFELAAKDGEMASLDEFVADGAFIHIERMDDDHIWIGITVNGRLWHVNLQGGEGTNGGYIIARVSDEGVRTQEEK